LPCLFACAFIFYLLIGLLINWSVCLLVSFVLFLFFLYWWLLFVYSLVYLFLYSFMIILHLFIHLFIDSFMIILHLFLYLLTGLFLYFFIYSLIELVFYSIVSLLIGFFLREYSAGQITIQCSEGSPATGQHSRNDNCHDIREGIISSGSPVE
jgi:hypothetical protein